MSKHPPEPQLPEYLAKTRLSKEWRSKRALCWEFEQFELERFTEPVLDSLSLVYSVHQKQERNGHKFVHGLLVFKVKRKYSSVHHMIGGGQYCQITECEDAHCAVTRCNDSRFPDSFVEQGTLKKLKKTKSKSKTKTNTISTNYESSEELRFDIRFEIKNN